VRHSFPVDKDVSALKFVPETLKTPRLCLEAVIHDTIVLARMISWSMMNYPKLKLMMKT
jgi:hypothetical protein